MLLAAIASLLVAGAVPEEPEAGWRRLAPGMDLRWLEAESPSPVGDSRIAVLRIDPADWRLELVGGGDPALRTAREWAAESGLAVVTNAGMFATDYQTHVGYLEHLGEVGSSRVNHYQSVAAFDPRDPASAPPFRIFDLDEPGVTVAEIRRRYASLVQNLRLIKRPGENRWSEQPKRWSEAALGEDRSGRILLVFSRSPFSMRELNAELLGAGIGLVALQHLEGGPEAQLYLRVGELELEIVGSYETSFREDDGNTAAWPIPNALGVRRREPRHENGAALKW